MDGSLLWLIPVVVVAGGKVADTARRGLMTRHERRMDVFKAKEQKRLAVEAANRPPEPVCGCTHHLAKHDRSGKCHEEVETATAWDADRKPLRYEARPCNCQQYIGPEPLGIVFAPTLIDPDGGGPGQA